MHIANFTPDPINWMHIGVEGTIAPDAIVEFEDARARHILNKYATRGLVQMNYKDEESVRREESMKRWTSFWENQIVMFNRHNEDQKEKGNRYADPTAELKQHAEKLGLELLKPWRIETKDSPEMKRLSNENVLLREELSSLKDQMKDLIKAVKASGAVSVQDTEQQSPKDPELEKTIESNRNKYKRLSEGNMNQWVSKNWDEIHLMPEENRIEIEKKYQEVYLVPFPKEKI